MQRERMLGFGALCALSLLVAAGIASAQAQGAPPAPPDTNAGLQRQVTLTPAQQLQETDTYLARMESARSVVRRLLEEARAQRDVVKTLCLNDKLNQIDVTLRSARERRQSLDLAVKRDDADLSSHEFTILGVLRQRVEQLTAEANQCIGKDADILGETSTVTQIDPGIPDDPAFYPPPIIVQEPPPSASVIK
ncbi:hypothetical protein [Polyangium jinanense]|uniref:Secreted protein n=1 Tax=Polyangium jinanense TaxID=2829994 RepID=A0A9X3X6W1_9BACT|nr:hypothetical protein [Polyangium jinanense]MDC3959465.1 hypothetical protein [Polyangium jinanense]MDC3984899.1 hypothetical protein [Polyangium jinanense]